MRMLSNLSKKCPPVSVGHLIVRLDFPVGREDIVEGPIAIGGTPRRSLCPRRPEGLLSLVDLGEQHGR